MSPSWIFKPTNFQRNAGESFRRLMSFSDSSFLVNTWFIHVKAPTGLSLKHASVQERSLWAHTARRFLSRAGSAVIIHWLNIKTLKPPSISPMLLFLHRHMSQILSQNPFSTTMKHRLLTDTSCHAPQNHHYSSPEKSSSFKKIQFQLHFRTPDSTIDSRLKNSDAFILFQISMSRLCSVDFQKTNLRWHFVRQGMLRVDKGYVRGRVKKWWSRDFSSTHAPNLACRRQIKLNRSNKTGHGGA